MQSIIELIETFVLGPLNYLDRLEGLFKTAVYSDSGHQFTIPRIDKGGRYSLREVEALLNRYGIAVYWRTYDGKHRYFRVKKRQAVWAEYLMLHAGVELQGPLLAPKNAHYVAEHPAGWMPKPWSAREEERKDDTPEQAADDPHSTTQSQTNTVTSLFQQFVEWW